MTSESIEVLIPPDGRVQLPRFAGKRVTVKIARDKASQKQFGYYRAIALPMLAEHLGYDKNEMDDLHEEILITYFKTKPGKLTGVLIPARRTSQLDTKEMAEFHDWLMRWAVKDFGVVLPDPDPNWRTRKAVA